MAVMCQQCGVIDPPEQESGGHVGHHPDLPPYLCGPVVEIDTSVIDAMRYFAHQDYGVIDWPADAEWDGDGDPPGWCSDCEQPWPCPGAVLHDALPPLPQSSEPF